MEKLTQLQFPSRGLSPHTYLLHAAFLKLALESNNNGISLSSLGKVYESAKDVGKVKIFLSISPLHNFTSERVQNPSKSSEEIE